MYAPKRLELRQQQDHFIRQGSRFKKQLFDRQLATGFDDAFRTPATVEPELSELMESGDLLCALFVDRHVRKKNAVNGFDASRVRREERNQFSVIYINASITRQDFGELITTMLIPAKFEKPVVFSVPIPNSESNAKGDH